MGNGDDWQGFLKESKSYMNYPTLHHGRWREWLMQLYLENGDPDLDYPGWTWAEMQKEKLEFWRKFPRAWFIFHWMWLCYEWRKLCNRITIL